MNNLILITGIGGPAGKSAVSHVHERGFRVFGADMRDVDVAVDEFRLLPAVSDAAFPASLLDLIDRERPSLFIPTGSEELPVVARLANDIRKRGCSVFISPSPAVDTAHDKLRTMRFFDATDIAVPRTFDAATPKDVVLKDLGLPFLAKPCIGRGGRGVVVYNDEAEFVADSRDGLIFQEFIPGEEFDVNLFATNDGFAATSVVLRKTALKQGIVGNALSVARDDNAAVDALGRRTATLLGMTGPLDMDVRLKEDGTPVLIEINARVGGNVLAASEILDALLSAWTREKRPS
jgi:carbamoylphosphate synthase large subunit